MHLTRQFENGSTESTFRVYLEIKLCTVNCTEISVKDEIERLCWLFNWRLERVLK
jgi:hypothetical protein